jgi:hypothetical protein
MRADASVCGRNSACARAGRTEELDAANLGEDLLGEDLVGGGGHFDFAFRHVCDCRLTAKAEGGDG